MTTLFYILLLEIIVLVLCVFLNCGDLLAPEFGFVACFIPGTLYAFFWAKRWSLDPSPMTVAVFASGFATFLTVSILLKKKQSASNSHVILNPFSYSIDVASWKLISLCIFQSVIFVETIQFLVTQYGVNASLAIFSFRTAFIEGTDNLPTILRMFRRVCLASGYITGYLFVLGIVTQKKKGRFLNLINTILSLVNGLTAGGRGDSVQMLFCFIMFFLLFQRTIKGRKAIRIHQMLKVAALVLLIGLTFAQIGEWLGRGMDRFKIPEYLAIYMSAEIKNLDTIVRQGQFGADLFHSKVFYEIMVHFMSKGAVARSEFQFVNGYELGNVSTVFEPFLHDLGYFGVFFYSAVMAVISQVSYRVATKPKQKKTIFISVIVYSHMWSCLVFSFFSNRFFEYLGTTFIWMALSWLVLRWFLCDMKLSFGGKKFYFRLPTKTGGISYKP